MSSNLNQIWQRNLIPRFFKTSIIQLLLITKTALWLKLEKLDKNSQGCAINSYRGGISSVQIEDLMCPQTGIIFRVEEFRAPISVRQCYNCQNFGHSAKDVKLM